MPVTSCSPQLTSLIDVMTILLVFLLKSFSTEGNLITPASDLQLPLSTSNNNPAVTATVKITRSSVLFNDTIVAANASFQKNSDMLIKPLYKRLNPSNQKLSDAESSASQKEMMIQSDKEIEFNIIKRVMYTCSKAGYSDFTILVMRQE